MTGSTPTSRVAGTPDASGNQTFDLAIIGGGINGAGIAADAAGRGLTVILIEKGDLGGATSSASSKLVHGGLRYLEKYEFRLVAEALAEREVLLNKAGHIIWPLRFIIPYVPGMRPRSVVRLGLFLYDRLARRTKIPASGSINLARDPSGRPIRSRFQDGFGYWDCWVDDARLVVLNAKAAAAKGATIATRTAVEGLTVGDGSWRIEARNAAGPVAWHARAIVNAAGPWAGDVAAMTSHATGETGGSQRLRLIKGSHIIVPRIEGAEDAYLLQNRDGRVVFALPYEEDFTLIGTTDVPYEGDPAAVAISDEERDYLLEVTERFFRVPPLRQQVVGSFAGVRPLYDDGAANPSAVSRDYHLVNCNAPGAPPVLHVYGGKITTYRRLAEAALEKLRPHFPRMGLPWTATAPLPGGDLGPRGIEGLRFDLLRRYPDMPEPLLKALVRRHGTEAEKILGEARTAADLGENFGGGLTAREVLYLRDHEWARTPEDVLWRRTKTGLHLSPEACRQVAERVAALLRSAPEDGRSC